MALHSPTSLPGPEAATRLPVVAQLYVTAVAMVALGSMWGESGWWHLALVAVALPTSLVALWVSFYARLAASLVLGLDPTGTAWPLVVVWVGVWTLTAWVNVQLVLKVRRAGWGAVPARPVTPYDDED